MQRLAARRQHLHLRPQLQQVRRQLGAGMRQVFAVIQDEQQLPVLDEFQQGFLDRTAHFLLDPEHRRHRLGDEPFIRQWRQLDEPHPVGKVV